MKYHIIMNKSVNLMNKLLKAKVAKHYIKSDGSLIIETENPALCQKTINNAGINYKLIFAYPNDYSKIFTI